MQLVVLLKILSCITKFVFFNNLFWGACDGNTHPAIALVEKSDRQYDATATSFEIRIMCSNFELQLDVQQYS